MGEALKMGSLELEKASQGSQRMLTILNFQKKIFFNSTVSWKIALQINSTKLSFSSAPG